MVRPFLSHGCILVLALAVCGCNQKPKVPSNPVASNGPVDNTFHGGGVETKLPARTGSEASGVEGSSTVIGAPPKGTNPPANAHGSS